MKNTDKIIDPHHINISDDPGPTSPGIEEQLPQLPDSDLYRHYRAEDQEDDGYAD